MAWLPVCLCQAQWLCSVLRKQRDLLENITSGILEQKVQTLTVKSSLFQLRLGFQRKHELLLSNALLTDGTDGRVPIQYLREVRDTV